MFLYCNINQQYLTKNIVCRRKGMTKEKLIHDMDAVLRFPGVANIWTQPIVNRINMLATGIRTPVGVKIFGSDLKKSEEIAEKIKEIVQNVRPIFYSLILKVYAIKELIHTRLTRIISFHSKLAHPLSSRSFIVSPLIIPLSATIQIRFIPKRFFKRFTIGSNVFTSVVLPGQSSLHTGLPSLSRITPTTIYFKSGR
jgi:hypothetical protein